MRPSRRQPRRPGSPWPLRRYAARSSRWLAEAVLGMYVLIGPWHTLQTRTSRAWQLPAQVAPSSSPARTKGLAAALWEMESPGDASEKVRIICSSACLCVRLGRMALQQWQCPVQELQISTQL